MNTTRASDLGPFEKWLGWAPGLFVLIHTDFTVLAVNESVARALRIDRDTVVGRSVFELFGELSLDSRENLESILYGLLESVDANREPRKLTEIRTRSVLTTSTNASVEDRFWDFTLFPVLENSGTVSGVILEARDVTERARLSKNHRASEILESITDAFFAVGRDWRFTYVNRQAENILDRRPGELLGRVIWDEFPGLIGSEFERASLLAQYDGVSSTVTAYYEDHDRWYEVHTYPSSEGISIYFQDASERKRAELDLEKLTADSENQKRVYEVALSNTPDLVYVFDLDHRFSYANEALLAMWGRTRAEAIGKNCLELGYEPWHAAMHDEEIETVVRTRKSIRGEVPFTGTNGRRIYEYIFVPVIGPDGQVVAVAGTTRDVTDRQQAEQAIRDQAEQLKQNDRRKDEFLAMLAHELRNPLSAVSNAVAVLRMADDPDNVSFAKEVIERQVRQLARLIDDLLDVSRITSGKIRLRRELIDAGTVLRQAIAAVRPLLDERTHHLHVDFQDGTLPIKADATRIEQIVVNLLTNAAKFTPNGGQIRLSAERVENEVVIEICDNGIGIPTEKLPEMFQLFAQGERSIARSEGGLGLGLTIVQKLAEMHGGWVSASSAGLNQGSTFTIHLPIALNEPREKLQLATSPAMPRGGSLILVVDDNEDTAKGMARLLKLLGNQVEIANDGPSAIEAARQFRPDYILLDIGLPGMDGYQVAATLREESCCRNSRIIAITGYGQSEDRRRSAAAGFDHHLVKPVDFDSLVTLIANPG